MVPDNLGTEKIREKSYGDQIGLEKKVTMCLFTLRVS